MSPGVDVALGLHPQLGEVLRQLREELAGPLRARGRPRRSGRCPASTTRGRRSNSASTRRDVARGEGGVAAADQVDVARRGDVRGVGGGDDAGPRRVDLVRRVEGHLGRDVDAERGHRRARAAARRTRRTRPRSPSRRGCGSPPPPTRSGARARPSGVRSSQPDCAPGRRRTAPCVIPRSVTSAMTAMSNSLGVSGPPSTSPSAPRQRAADHREPR